MPSKPHNLPPVKWTLSKLIDYELYLDADKHEDHDSLVHRDNSIRSKIISHSAEKPSQEDSPHNRRWWIYQWLSVQDTKKDYDESSIGELCQESLKILGFWICLAAASLGVVFTFATIITSEVIMVSYVLLICLLPQMILLLLAGWAFLNQRFGRAKSSPLGIRAILLNILNFIASRAKVSQKSELRLQKIQAATGQLIGRGKIHRDTLGWPLLAILQKSGFYFSLSGILCIFFVGLTSPRNFGWGSSAKWVDTSTAHSITTTLSAPWSWLIPESVGSPTLDEVKSSQIFIGKNLPEDFPHLSSLWIFMCLCLITYSLIPRLALYSYSKWKVHQSLDREKFSDSRSDQLFRRLASPPLITIYNDEEPTEGEDTIPAPRPPIKSKPESSPIPVSEPLCAPKQEPLTKTEPDHYPDPVAKPISKPEPTLKSKPESSPTPVSEPLCAPKQEPLTKTEPDHYPAPVAKPISKPEPTLKSKPESPPTPVSEPLSSPTPKPIPASKTKPEPRGSTSNLDKPSKERVPQAHCEIFTELELTSKQLSTLKERFQKLRHLGIHKSNRAYSKKEREAAFERLKQLEWQDDIPRIVLLYRGCDPIVSNFRTLVKTCVNIIGSEGQLFFCLASRRNSTTPPISPTDLEIWSDFVNAQKLEHPNSEIVDLTKETL